MEIIENGRLVGGSEGVVSSLESYYPPSIKRVTPAVTVAAYSINHIVGLATALTTVTSTGQTSSIWAGLTVTSKTSTVIPALTIMMFDSLTGGTYADKGNVTWGSGDPTRYCGQVGILAADWSVRGSQAFVSVQFEIPCLGSSTSLTPIVFADSAFTPTSTSEFSFSYSFRRMG